MKIYSEFDLAESGNARLNELLAYAADFIRKYHRYKLMWELRTLEQEMNEEAGAVILRPTGKVEIKGFSELLMTKIKDLLSRPEFLKELH